MFLVGFLLEYDIGDGIFTIFSFNDFKYFGFGVEHFVAQRSGVELYIQDTLMHKYLLGTISYRLPHQSSPCMYYFRFRELMVELVSV